MVHCDGKSPDSMPIITNLAHEESAKEGRSTHRLGTELDTEDLPLEVGFDSAVTELEPRKRNPTRIRHQSVRLMAKPPFQS